MEATMNWHEGKDSAVLVKIYSPFHATVVFLDPLKM